MRKGDALAGTALLLLAQNYYFTGGLLPLCLMGLLLLGWAKSTEG